jgi:hypothetical protein
MRQVVHLTCMGEVRNTKKFLLENLEGRDHFRWLGIDGGIILKLSLNIWGMVDRIHLSEDMV